MAFVLVLNVINNYKNSHPQNKITVLQAVTRNSTISKSSHVSQRQGNITECVLHKVL